MTDKKSAKQSDKKEEDDMTIDEETERRESRQIKDRLIDACNHGQKRYLFNMEKIEKKYARLTKDQHVGTAILFDVKDGKWKFGEEELRVKDAAGYINNIARKNNQIGFANISAPCNSEVLKDQVSNRALKRIQMLDQKFNERLDLEKRGAMVVWGKNKEVAEPNRNGRMDWQRASMQSHIIRETETIEVVERIIKFPSSTFDADYARLFDNERKKNDGLAIEMEQLSIGECNQFFLPARSPPKKLSAPSPPTPKPEVVDTDVPLPADVQVECEIDFPQDENVQSNEDKDSQNEREPLTLRQLMTPVQEEEKEAEQCEEGAEGPNESVPEIPQQSQILDELNEEAASPASFPVPFIPSIATPESRLNIGSSAASQNRKRRRTADEMMIEDAQQLLSPQRKVKRESELWFQTLDNITDIFSDSSELKTVFGIKRESIPSVLLNYANPIELWINTPSLVEEVDEKFDDFDKRIRRMHAQARQAGMNSLAGYVRQ